MQTMAAPALDVVAYTPTTDTPQTTFSRSVCPYCGVGCGIVAESRVQNGRREMMGIKGDRDHPANSGARCAKGITAPQMLTLDHRLLYPQTRRSQDRMFERVTWDTALGDIAHTFRRIVAEHGSDAVAFYGSGQFLTEDYYVAQKLVKGFLGTNNFDANSRLCMSSAVAGYSLSLGQVGPPAS